MSEPRPPLRRRAAFSAWQSLALRGLMVVGLVGIALAGHWLDRAGLRDNVDGEVSFVDVVYFTTITVTTVGYGDIVPVTDRARLFDALVVTPIRLFVWLIFLGTAYSFIFRRTWEQWRTRMIERALGDHVIVCGYGVSGEAAVGELFRQGAKPGSVVVIDIDEARVDAATACGAIGVVGDAATNAVMNAAGIGRARAVIATPGRDDTTALVVLTARQLAPGAHIAASVRSVENEDLVRQAGASSVINPASFGGHLLARACEGERSVSYLHDLATAGGRVVLCERPVTLAEVGRPLSSLDTGVAVRLHRAGRAYEPGDSEATAIEEGDVVVEIVRNAALAPGR